MSKFKPIYIHTGTIIDIKPCYTFGSSLVLTVGDNKGNNSKVYIPLPKAREIVDNILGYKSKSKTEINNTFISYALNKTFFRFSEVKKEAQNKPTKYIHGWTII